MILGKTEMKIKSTYICEICDCEYATEHEALLCEAYPLTPNIAEVGDFVLIKQRYDDFETKVQVIAQAGVRPPYAVHSHWDVEELKNTHSTGTYQQ